MFSKVTKCVKGFTNIITLGILTVPVMREIHEPYVVLLSYATFSIMSSLPNQSVQPLRLVSITLSCSPPFIEIERENMI